MVHWPKGAQTQLTTFGGLTRSQLMSRVRSRGNKTTELLAAKLFRANGITGWRRHSRLVGKPDFVWPKSRVALFVDGCFWHGHACGRNLSPKTNATLWREKIVANKMRDRQNTYKLRATGWKVLRLWECSLTKNQSKCIRRLRKALESA